ncbi:hypothetical protein [Alteromonas sp. ASW11-130]|uniref:hypothetical protein n=1 Tax=Alteromonas sp. ASW11-130 TaxID=3015775 RepID=UPI002242224C|nr:hypothetical protein [Alteromonas sp. ASW11-130]MCW8093295.1 hypothetical protein [Alteromonas sp. ASW11-130]
MKEIIINLIEHALWPLAVVFAVVVLKNEIKKLLSRMSGFKAGDIEIRMRQQIHSQTLTQSQLEKLAALSSAEIDMFLLVTHTDAIGFSYNVPISKDLFDERLRYFQELGLIKVYFPEKKEELATHTTTAEGRRIREAIINGASQLLKSAI